LQQSPKPNPSADPSDSALALLRPRAALALALSFAAAMAVTHVSALAICAAASIDNCPRYWPISVFELRAPPRLYYPNLTHVLIAVGLTTTFVLAIVLLRRIHYPWYLVTTLGFIVILGSNLAQGWQYGIRRPTDGLGLRTNQYYHDALKINDPVEFFSNFTRYQADLQTHSRSHPPGAVLSYFLLAKYLRDPAAISIVIAAIATLVSSTSLYLLIGRTIGKPNAGYVLLLFLVLPAVQIYFLASLDALIVGFALLSLSLVMSERSVATSIAGGLSLFVLSLLTFAFVFVVAILLYVWLRSRQRRDSFPVAIATLLAAHVLTSAVTHFSYIESFAIASAMENPQGYRLLLDPVTFALTRLEGLAELALFAGPFMLAASYLGWKRREPSSELSHVTEGGVAALLLMLLAGVFRTGETARAAMFVYPILILPIGYAIDTEARHPSTAATVLLALVFAQGLLMQLAGNYFW